MVWIIQSWWYGLVDATRKISYHIYILDTFMDDIEGHVRVQGGQIEQLIEDMEKILCSSQQIHFQHHTPYSRWDCNKGSVRQSPKETMDFNSFGDEEGY